VRRIASAIVLLALMVACGSPDRASTTSPSTLPASPTTTTTTTSTSPATSTTTTSVTTTTTTMPAALTQGATGAEVSALQDNLLALGYWIDAADGVFGVTTTHAVVAFQKRAGLEPDGVAGPDTLAALAGAARPTAQTTSGHVIEIDLSLQTMLVVDDGHVGWVFDTSTGAVAGTTPTGEWSVYRQVNGYDHGPLGTLYRPKYFHQGVAVHGYPSVPAHPASHGCVRVLDQAMDWIWENDVMPIGTTVVVY
jgi:N-acetylmuramoyl-L-alanine amidase